MPARKDLPSTLRRSVKSAQDTWIKTHDSAVGTYGEGRRAFRVAYAALKNQYERVGDHWESKRGKGPSGRRAAQAGRPAQRRPRSTAGGVDATASKEHLYGMARRLDIPGRSRMTKPELVTAIRRTNARRTARARRRQTTTSRQR